MSVFSECLQCNGQSITKKKLTEIAKIMAVKIKIPKLFADRTY